MKIWQMAVLAGLMTGCVTVTKTSVGGDLTAPMIKARAMEGVLPFSGKPLWDSGISFVVKGTKVDDLALLRKYFDVSGVPTTERDIVAISNFIAIVAQEAPVYKGRTIDLAAILAEMRNR